MPKGARSRVVTLVVCCAVSTIALAPSRATAADSPSPERTRVRVTSPLGRMVGTLVRVDADAVSVQPSGKDRSVRLTRDAITQIEVSRQRSNRGKGIMLGLLAGAAAGGLVGALVQEDCTPTGGLFDSLCTDLRGTSIGAGVAIGAPVGALLGYVLSHGERWESTTADRLRVAIVPKRGGGEVRLSFGF